MTLASIPEKCVTTPHMSAAKETNRLCCNTSSPRLTENSITRSKVVGRRARAQSLTISTSCNRKAAGYSPSQSFSKASTTIPGERCPAQRNMSAIYRNRTKRNSICGLPQTTYNGHVFSHQQSRGCRRQGLGIQRKSSISGEMPRHPASQQAITPNPQHQSPPQTPSSLTSTNSSCSRNHSSVQNKVLDVKHNNSRIANNAMGATANSRCAKQSLGHKPPNVLRNRAISLSSEKSPSQGIFHPKRIASHPQALARRESIIWTKPQASIPPSRSSSSSSSSSSSTTIISRSSSISQQSKTRRPNQPKVALGGALIFEKKISDILNSKMNTTKPTRNQTPSRLCRNVTNPSYIGCNTTPRRRAQTLNIETTTTTTATAGHCGVKFPELNTPRDQNHKFVGHGHDVGVEFKSPELGKDKFGYGGDGQVVGVEECGERIDRLLRKVQQSRREATVRREISSSTIAPGTPTRFDIDYHPGEFGTNTGKRHQDTHRQRSKTICIESPMSTVRVKQLEQPKTTSNDKNTPAPAKNNTQAKPQRVSTTDIRKKLEALREKRRKAQMPDSILSPRSLSEKSPCTRGPSGGLGIVGDPEPMDDTDDSSSTQVDFFDQESVVAMFQEIPLQLKDPDWDKRVYYHHISQTNDEYKRLVDDIKILDCRDECLTEMVGSRRAEKLRLPSPKDLIKSGDAPNITLRNRQSHSSPHRPELNSASDSKEATSSTDSESTFSVFPNSNSIDLSADFWLEQQPGKPMPTSPLGVGEDNIEAITEWLEEDSDGEGSDSTSDVDLSFDWTRDGFGYMEFRRLSRMPANSQQAQDSEKTPKHSAPPSNTTTPATGLRYAMNDNRPATQLLKPGEHRVSMSTIMEASHERDSCSVAMASLNQNIKSPLLPSQHVKGATPTATQAPLPAPEGKAPLAAMSKNPTSISSFASPFLSQHQHQPRNSYEAMQINLVHKLRKENEYLKSEVQQTKSAIAALTRLVLRHQENFYSNVDSIRTQLGQLSISPPASPSQAYDP